MDTPFNFEKNRREGEESDYIKGKNKISNEAHAAETAHASTDRDIQALLEKAIDSVGSAKLHTETEDDMHAEHYADANPITRQRRYLLDLLKKTPELHEEITDLPAERKEQIKSFLAAIIADSKVFSQEKTADDLNAKHSIEKNQPFGQISDLYTTILSRFKEEFFTEINVLNIIPEHISVSDNDVISTATFAVSLDPEALSVKFRDTFPNSSIFVISYRYDSSHKKPHELQLIGMTSSHETDNVVELTL